MHFELGTEPAMWATGELPPSPASEFGTEARDSVPFVEPHDPLPSSTRGITNSPVAKSTQDSVSGGALKGREIAVIVVFSVLGTVGLVALAWFILRRARRRRAAGGVSPLRDSDGEKVEKEPRGTPPVLSSDSTLNVH